MQPTRISLCKRGRIWYVQFTATDGRCRPKSTRSEGKREALHHLLDAIREPWLREIVLFVTLTGMRRGEIVNLKWKSVDFSHRVIHVTSDDTFHTKLGRRRTIPMNEVCRTLLSLLLLRCEGEYVFHIRARPHHPDTLSRLLKHYVRALSLDGRLHFHSLRHSFASWLAQANVSIYTLKELLGHSDVKTTEVYSHLQPERLHEVVNRIVVDAN